MSENNLQRNYMSGGSEIASYLTAMSAAGYDFEAVHMGVLKSTLTLKKVDRPNNFYYTYLPTKHLYQPEGWDFVFSDRQGAYFRVPLPAPSETRKAPFASGDVEEETLWLEILAEREGKQLLAVDGMTYTFLPLNGDPNDPPLRYRVVTFEDIVEGDDRSELLLKLPEKAPYVYMPQGEGIPTDESDTDTDQWYFICVSRGSVTAAYYASRPCLLPPAEGKTMTSEVYRKTHLQERVSLQKIWWALVLVLLLPNRDTMWQDWLLMAIALGIMAVAYLFYRLTVRKNLNRYFKELDRESGAVPVPTSPRNIRIRGSFKLLSPASETASDASVEMPDPTAVDAARRASQMPMPDVHSELGYEYLVPPPKEQPLSTHWKTLKSQNSTLRAAILLGCVFAVLSVIQVVGTLATPPVQWVHAVACIFALAVWSIGTVACICESVKISKRLKEMKKRLEEEDNA